ncbi:unnamed protein product, partial [Didymodactylos carnosus]
QKQSVLLDESSVALKWSTIPIMSEIKNNYYIFVWSPPNLQQAIEAAFVYRNGNHNLRAIDRDVSVRAKRALMTSSSSSFDIGENFDIVYDAFLDTEGFDTVPSVEMIIEVTGTDINFH